MQERIPVGAVVDIFAVHICHLWEAGHSPLLAAVAEEGEELAGNAVETGVVAYIQGQVEALASVVVEVVGTEKAAGRRHCPKTDARVRARVSAWVADNRGKAELMQVGDTLGVDYRLHRTLVAPYLTKPSSLVLLYFVLFDPVSLLNTVAVLASFLTQKCQEPTDPELATFAVDNDRVPLLPHFLQIKEISLEY